MKTPNTITLKFLDTQAEITLSELGFGIFEDGTMICGVVRQIKNNKAAFGYKENLRWTDKVYKHYPKFRLKLKPKEKQLNLFYQ